MEKVCDTIVSTTKTVHVVLDSPHSCNVYPADFTPVATREQLLTSWDAWVDELFSGSVGLGAHMLVANFPRFYIDVNRGRDDIDPKLLQQTWTGDINPSDKSAVGMGLLRRLALPNVPVHDRLLTNAEITHRITQYYDPYYEALKDLIDTCYQKFNKVIHLNCHSMKSVGNAMNDDNGKSRPDIVVSDIFHQTAHADITHLLADIFRQNGLTTQVNDPYKGAELVRKYSDVKNNKHSIQIELNRALYMNEKAFTKKQKQFTILQNTLTTVVKEFIEKTT